MSHRTIIRPGKELRTVPNASSLPDTIEKARKGVGPYAQVFHQPESAVLVTQKDPYTAYNTPVVPTGLARLWTRTEAELIATLQPNSAIEVPYPQQRALFITHTPLITTLANAGIDISELLHPKYPFSRLTDDLLQKILTSSAIVDAQGVRPLLNPQSLPKPAKKYTRRQFIVGFSLLAAAVGGTLYSGDKKQEIKESETAPAEAMDKPDMQGLALIAQELNGNKVPQGGCLGGFNDIIHVAAQKHGLMYDFSNLLRYKPYGCVDATHAIEFLRHFEDSARKANTPPEFYEAKDIPTERTSLIQYLNNLPNGAVVCFTGTKGDAIDIYQTETSQVNGPTRNAGHISIKVGKNLVSDGSASIKNYVEWMLDKGAAPVVFFLHKDRQKTLPATVITPKLGELFENSKHKQEIINTINSFTHLQVGDVQTEESRPEDQERLMVEALENSMHARDPRTRAELGLVLEMLDLYYSESPAKVDQFVELYLTEFPQVFGQINRQQLTENKSLKAENGKLQLGDLFTAFAGVNSPIARTVLMKLYREMTLQNESIRDGFPRVWDGPVGDGYNEIQFCREHGLPAEMLQAAKGGQNLFWLLASMKDESGKPIFFDGTDFPQSFDDVFRFMPDAGLIATILHTETKGGTDTGVLPARYNTNQAPGHYPTSQADLRRLTEYFQSQMGISLPNLVGSTYPERYVGIGSGGAVGPGLMPIYAVDFVQRWEKARAVLLELHNHDIGPMNLFDPTVMAAIIALRIGGQTVGLQGQPDGVSVLPFEHINGGYKVSPLHCSTDQKDNLKRVISTWNGDPTQIQQVIQASTDYKVAFEC